MGSAAHFAHSAILVGLALPVTHVVISSFAIEYCSASLAMSLPRSAQCFDARAATSRTCGGALCHLGRGALINSRALHGGAFMTPIPFPFRYGTRSASIVFCSV